MLGCSLLDAIHFTTNHSERARLIHQLASLLRFEIERVTKKQRPSKELLKDTGDYTLILASSSVARELCSISKGPPLLVEPAGGTLAYLARGALDRDDGGLLHASLQMLMGREKTQAPLEIIELPGVRGAPAWPPVPHAPPRTPAPPCSHPLTTHSMECSTPSFPLPSPLVSVGRAARAALHAPHPAFPCPRRSSASDAAA